jgi:hypothetical protein
MLSLDSYELSIVQWWREVGSVSQGGMSVSSLEWTQINSWAERNCSLDSMDWVYVGDDQYRFEKVKSSIILDYEIDMIMQLSREYCNEYHEAVDPKRPCPKEIVLEEVDGLEESTALGNAFIAMFSAPNDVERVTVER